jgi:hypothetical protein
MEFVLFVLIVVLWKLWLYPLLSLVRFLPDSFFIPDSTPIVPTSKPRKQYTDTTPDPFTDLFESGSIQPNQFMSAEDKQTYLKSRKWQSIKAAVLQRDQYKCQVCGSTSNLEVHHVTYQGLGGNEELSDLATLCRFHHQSLHDRLGYDRGTTFNFSILK